MKRKRLKHLEIYICIYFFKSGLQDQIVLHDKSKNMSSRADSVAWLLLGTGGGSFQEDVS